MPTPRVIDHLADAVDAVLAAVPGDIVLGIPLAIGKPNAFVNALYRRIAADPRHGAIELLVYEEITERRFAGWAMGQVDMSRLNAALLLKYSEKPLLDPYALPGSASMALLQELMATASIVGNA